MPHEEGALPIRGAEIGKYLSQIPAGWTVEEEAKIKKEFKFRDFKEAIGFVMQVAELAEAEGHHPDILIFFKWVTIQLWTRAVGGLSENDFILAAKIDKLVLAKGQK